MAFGTSCKNNETKGGLDGVEKNPVVTIVIKDYGTIKAELYPDVAPISVANFVCLAQEGFYDGSIFHRVIKNFMIQGGAPKNGKLGYTIKGEFASNGVKNSLAHVPGVLSMARADAKNSAGSQFFICVSKCDWLDGDYAAFGKVTEGLEIATKISKITSKDGNDRPYTDVVIESVTVDTFGYDYTEFWNNNKIK